MSRTVDFRVERDSDGVDDDGMEECAMSSVRYDVGITWLGLIGADAL